MNTDLTLGLKVNVSELICAICLQCRFRCRVRKGTYLRGVCVRGCIYTVHSATATVQLAHGSGSRAVLLVRGEWHTSRWYAPHARRVTHEPRVCAVREASGLRADGT